MQDKLKKLYFKLLKASVNHKRNKMLRLEDKLIQLELEIRNTKEILNEDNE